MKTELRLALLSFVLAVTASLCLCYSQQTSVTSNLVLIRPATRHDTNYVSEYQAEATNFLSLLNTNESVWYTNSQRWSAEDLVFKAKENRTLTNLVNLLVSSGDFCRIKGHVWRDSTQHFVDEQQRLLMFLPREPFEQRTCGVCGTNQFRIMPAWPTP